MVDPKSMVVVVMTAKQWGDIQMGYGMYAEEFCVSVEECEETDNIIDNVKVVTMDDIPSCVACFAGGDDHASWCQYVGDSA